MGDVACFCNYYKRIQREPSGQKKTVAFHQSRRLRYWFLGVGKSCGMFPIFSHVAEPTAMKLSGIVEYGLQNDLAKEFFEKFEK